ncbi:MAG: PspA/IM30 family protein [Planctomycetota bacterium]|jgi:phage shock protein A
MGRIDQLRTITKSRIEAFLASLEKPETILPRLVEELGERIQEATRAEAKALSAVKGDLRRLDAGLGKIARFKEGAALAVKANEIDTARQAIAAQIQAEREVEKCRSDLAVSESAYNSASGVRTQLQQNLKDLKLKKKEILERSREIRRRQSLDKTLNNLTGHGGKSILDIVTKMEIEMEEAEAQIEIQDEITQTLGVGFPYERVKVLESDAEVDRRLNEMRGKIQGG